jgi:hypothetical protein
MAGEGRPSTPLLITARKAVDADSSLRLGQALRQHDDGAAILMAPGVTQVKIRGPRQNYESAGAIDDFRGVVPPLVGAISG